MCQFILCLTIAISGCTLRVYGAEEVEKRMTSCLQNGGSFKSWSVPEGDGEVSDSYLHDPWVQKHNLH